MSENSTPEERTEDPTEKRMQELRKKGSMHMSTEVMQISSLITAFLVLQLIWEWLFSSIQSVMRQSFLLIAADFTISATTVYSGAFWVLKEVGLPVICIGLCVSAISILAVMLQTKWNMKEKLIEVKLSKLNPINGIKRIFSLTGVVNTLKAIIKLALILPIAFFALRALAPYMIMLMHTSVPVVFEYTGRAMVDLFWKIMYVLIAFALFDYFYTRWEWLKQNRMTKEEVKDERKAVEGDEKTKRKIQAKGLERIVQRIQQSVPQADVVVTNPTHYSVALSYNRSRMDAPVVVAKGKGFLALRIRELARANGVPVLERKPLARALYHSTEVGAQIPRELFKAVAEVLAYVFRLRRPQSQRANV